MSLRLVIDPDLCQGHGVCEAEAPELFAVTEGDGPYPQARVLVSSVPEELRRRAEKAVRYCPNSAIRLIED